MKDFSLEAAMGVAFDFGERAASLGSYQRKNPFPIRPPASTARIIVNSTCSVQMDLTGCREITD
jgi:hypothetical protein